MRIIVLTIVLDYLEDLIIILYEKEYFGFLETSSNYVMDLLDDIEVNFPTYPMRHAPPYFDRYGKDMYYAVFRKSKNTQWYVFFRMYKENGEVIYQVRYISNNHVIAQYL